MLGFQHSGILDRFRRLSLDDMVLLSEALAALAVSSVAIRFLPFRMVGRLASAPLGGRRGPSVDHVAWAVKAIARRVPWRAVCFQEGLAAHTMLRRRGIDSTLFFGAANKPAQGLLAHVWVKVGDTEVVGCEEAPGFAVLARFPRPQARQSAAFASTAEPKRFDQPLS